MQEISSMVVLAGNEAVVDATSPSTSVNGIEHTKAKGQTVKTLGVQISRTLKDGSELRNLWRSTLGRNSEPIG
jgi:hypothetical protein